MATTPMYRVVTTVTGVAGSPYYLVGYFSAASEAPGQAVEAWHEFAAPQAGDAPAGSAWRTAGLVAIVSPVSGDVIGQADSGDYLTTGTSTEDFCPPATQALVRWRTGVYVGGREIRGRTNLPLVRKAWVSPNGTLTSAYLSALTIRGSLLSDSPGATHVVWSKKNGQWEPTSSANAWNQFSVLRSRRD